MLSLLGAVLLFSFVCVNGFNLDTINYARYQGNQSSMFGFSVATHKERGNSWILVGAPEAQNVYQQSVRRGGAVYKCSIDADNYCDQIPFDTKGDNADDRGRFLDYKSEQWFGATINTAGVDGPIVACAPRYVYFASKRDRRDPVGTCYVSKSDFSSYSEYSPCRTNLSGYHRQGSCQAGFGAAISKDGKRLFIGGPGSWYWQGQMYSIDAHRTFPYTPGKYGSGVYGTGQLIQQSLDSRPGVIATREGPEKDDNSYMGYSVAVGDFTGEGTQGVAVGMPRGGNLLGKIVLFTWNLTNHQNITGEQLGAYFGYAIAVADVDGDKQDDIIIGAPLYTIPNNEGKYEVGRVYIIYQGRSSEGRFRRKSDTLDGFNSKSRFGLSLASLGDVNLDGYGDFAVGAPYDGPRERGAVYIFHGSQEGVREKYSQVIYAEDTSAGGYPVSTFGFSVGGGLDLDENEYPDMVVGAYLSNTAYFFRSRPVVKIDAFVRFMTANKQIILDEKNCTLNNRQPVPCTTVDFCIKFSGIGVPHSIELNVQYILDSKKTKDPRMYFLPIGNLVLNENMNVVNETIFLQKDARQVCKPKTVYIKNDIRDKLTPLEAEVHYSMSEARVFQQTHQRNPRATLKPILDLNTPPVKKDSISVHKNCGPDNICIPNLRLIVQSNVERYLLGSNEKLVFDIIVQNEGEDSFESTFDIQLPPGVDFNKVIENNKTEVRTSCSMGSNNTIHCDIGNPLPAGKIAHFKIQMKPYHKEGMKPSYDFFMVVNSTNPENIGTTSDNRKEVSIHIWVDSKLELQGISRPSDIHYNPALYTVEKIERESDIGPQVIHVYSIKNNGPSSINEAEMLFLWPYATLADEDLLYLLEQPHTLGNVKCDAVQANYRGYELEYRKKSIWETIGLDVSKGDFSSAAQGGGLFIEEGLGTSGSTGGEKVNKVDHDFEQSGDGSFVHLDRRKQQKAEGEGNTYVAGGGGSRYNQQGSSSSWNRTSGGPTFTHTYSKNSTSYTGPDGKTVYTESSSGDRGVLGNRFAAGGSFSGGRTQDFGSTQTSGGTYTQSSGGSSSGQTGGSYSRENSQSSGSSYSGGRTQTSGGAQSSSGGTGSFSGGTHSSSGGSQYSGGGSQSSGGETQSSGGRTQYSSGGTHSGGEISVTGGGGHYSSSTHGAGSTNHSTGGAHVTGGAVHVTGGAHATEGGSGTHETGRGSQSTSGGTITHTSSGSSSGAVYRPNIVYTSSGGQNVQEGGLQSQTGSKSFTTNSDATTSGSGRIDKDYSITNQYESRQSGQDFKSEEGGKTIYEGGSYPGKRPQMGVNRHFDWNGDSSQRGQQETQEEYYRRVQIARGGHGGYYDQSGRGYESRQHAAHGDGAARHETHSSNGSRHEESSRDGQTYTSSGTTFNSRERNDNRQETHNQGGAYGDLYDNTYSSEEYTGASNENLGYDEESHRNAAAGSGSQTWKAQGHGSEQTGDSNNAQSGQGGGRVRGQYDNRNFEQDYAQHGLGAAALGHGFKTTTLDIGSLGGGSNVDISAGHSNSYDQDLGGAAQGNSYSRGHSSSSSGSNTYDQDLGGASHGSSYNRGESNQGNQGSGQRWESRSESSWSSSGSGTPPKHIERDNVPTDKPNLNNRFTGRKKREVQNNDDIRDVIQCKSTKCLTVRCTVGPMMKDQDATIVLRSRVNIRALKNISTSQTISFSSMMLARISRLPYIGTPLDRQIHSHEIFTTVPAPEPDIKPDIVPLWVVVLSAVAGTIALLLLIFLLYKCGFFKRNRPSNAPERQPLNRNGHYQNGDEQL